MTIRVDEALKEKLDLLAQATKRSKSWLAAEALKEFVELNEWQITEISQALKEADAEDFADNQEVTSAFGKWGVDAG